VTRKKGKALPVLRATHLRLVETNRPGAQTSEEGVRENGPSQVIEKLWRSNGESLGGKERRPDWEEYYTKRSSKGGGKTAKEGKHEWGEERKGEIRGHGGVTRRSRATRNSFSPQPNHYSTILGQRANEGGGQKGSHTGKEEKIPPNKKRKREETGVPRHFYVEKEGTNGEKEERF